ncbi:MAG: carboxypeptidase regulatory-like domain-containing protein [Thermosipho sp. (in: Bacteria)]|nr:carboxypeptidase regulatory-like domain-containing protein [Thermosipho sp. (in: thermotogales)]
MKKTLLIIISMIALLIIIQGCFNLIPVITGSTITGVARFFDKVNGQHAGIVVTLQSNAATKTTVTDANGNYTFTGLALGNYVIIASDPSNNYFPASLVITIAATGTKTVQDLVLTKVINHVIIFREAESGWANAGVPTTVIGDILTSKIGMTQGTGINQYEYRSLRGGSPNLQFNFGDLLIIEGDQPQDFYDIYTANKSVFDSFVYNGGSIFWVAADNGWASGDFTSTLPGSVTWRDQYETHNDIVTFNHPITRNFPPQMEGNYASHGGFQTANNPFINNLVTYLRETNGLLPTFIEYRYGFGRILATTTPLEWYVTNGPTNVPPNYNYNISYKDLFVLMLTRALKYFMGLPVSPNIQ